MADDIHGKDGPNVARVKARAAVPAAASPQIIPAPGAGPRMIHHQRTSYMTENGPRDRAATMDGFHAVRGADVFDLMLARSRSDTPPFTPGQVEAGRQYGWLRRELQSCGYARGVDLTGGASGTGGGSYIDAVLHNAARLRAMQAAAGNAVVLTRHGQAADRHQGRVLGTLALLDHVCWHGQNLSEVLGDFGWEARDRYRKRLTLALAAALERIWEG